MLKNNKLMIKKTILGAVVAMSCMQAFAADYTDGNIRKNVLTGCDELNAKCGRESAIWYSQ